VLTESGIGICRAYLETILKNRFYTGYFLWQGVAYKGTHEPLIDAVTFDRVQRVFSGRNKPKYRKHDFAFAGLLTWAHDGCTVTTELHKGKYVYYRCSYGRGKCGLPCMREQQVSDRLGDVLRDIYVPDHVVKAIVQRVESDQGHAETERRERLAGIQQLSSDSRQSDRAWTRCTRTSWTGRSMSNSGRERYPNGVSRSESSKVRQNR